MDKRGTQTNQPKNKEITPRDDIDSLYQEKKKEEEGLPILRIA